MKKYFAALSTTALICVAPHALATSTADLTVTGIITPNACTPSFSSGGIVDVGTHSAGDLNQSSNTLVNTTPIALTMACDAQTLFTLRSVDNREGTAFGTGFGVGLDPDDNPLGQFNIRVMNATADTVAVTAVGSRDNGNTWAAQPTLTKDTLSSVAATGTPTTRIAVKDLAMNLEIDTYIARADSLTLDDEITLDGSATIEVGYN